ncbi:DUF4365 domain-containing protein [Streptomyces apocyni]|uniref:DUF4365 domain-containing protein n=1 Tax=Streptomyces apocyni TaxID=2654677 RepID=UPI0012EA0A48|nr:DUF4365 domain-containing protein [Streptomyces apocyni]
MTEHAADGVPRQQPYRGNYGVPLTPAMGDNGHRGDYGEQFVQALAVAANLDVSSKPWRDRQGTDWEFGHPGRSGTIRFPKIVAQVKCWGTPKGDDAAWDFQLKRRNFNLLAGRGWQHPRFLFLVIAPYEVADWVDVTHDRLLMRNAAYWACFHDEEPDETRTTGYRRVAVPKANLLTVDALHGLFSGEYREMLVTS